MSNDAFSSQRAFPYAFSYSLPAQWISFKSDFINVCSSLKLLLQWHINWLEIWFKAYHRTPKIGHSKNWQVDSLLWYLNSLYQDCSCQCFQRHIKITIDGLNWLSYFGWVGSKLRVNGCSCYARCVRIPFQLVHYQALNKLKIRFWFQTIRLLS